MEANFFNRVKGPTFYKTTGSVTTEIARPLGVECGPGLSLVYDSVSDRVKLDVETSPEYGTVSFTTAKTDNIDSNLNDNIIIKANNTHKMTVSEDSITLLGKVEFQNSNVHHTGSMNITGSLVVKGTGAVIESAAITAITSSTVNAEKVYAKNLYLSASTAQGTIKATIDGLGNTYLAVGQVYSTDVGLGQLNDSHFANTANIDGRKVNAYKRVTPMSQSMTYPSGTHIIDYRSTSTTCNLYLPGATPNPTGLQFEVVKAEAAAFNSGGITLVRANSVDRINNALTNPTINVASLYGFRMTAVKVSAGVVYWSLDGLTRITV